MRSGLHSAGPKNTRWTEKNFGHKKRCCREKRKGHMAEVRLRGKFARLRGELVIGRHNSDAIYIPLTQYQSRLYEHQT
jgi:hypothetical protein